MRAGEGDSDGPADLATVGGEWYDMIFCAAPTAEDDGDAVPHVEHGDEEDGVFGSGSGDIDFDFDVDLYALVTAPARTLVTRFLRDASSRLLYALRYPRANPSTSKHCRCTISTLTLTTLKAKRVQSLMRELAAIAG